MRIGGAYHGGWMGDRFSIGLMSGASALLLACGGALPPTQTPSSDSTPEHSPEASRHDAAGVADDSTCPPLRAQPERPNHQSKKLYFDVPESTMLGPMLLRADSKEPLRGPSLFEIELISPTGQVRTHKFSHQNEVEVCPKCLPSGKDDSACRNVRCYWDSVGAARVQLPHEFIDEAGEYVLTLHHPSTGEKLTRRMEVGKGMQPECSALPEQIGSYQRENCTSAIVPIGARYWGTRARYQRGQCRANVFSLRLSQAQRVIFDSGWGKAKAVKYPEGTVRRIEIDEGVLSAWLASEHAFFVATAKGVAGHEEVVRELLKQHPPPVKKRFVIPACQAHEAIAIATESRKELLRKASVFAEYDGNQVIGVKLGTITQGRWFERAHFRPYDVVYSFNGKKIDSLERVEAFIAALSKPGTLRVVLMRRDFPPKYPGGVRCHTLTLSAP